MATYVDPVPNATARNWGGAQYHAAGNTGTGSKNVGADYLAPYGSPLYAPIGGRVVQVFNSKLTGTEAAPGLRKNAVNENYGWGTSVVIQGDDGYYHRLSHLVPNSPLVREGATVQAGQQIGQVGQSGNTVGSGKAGGAPHLDWEKFTSKSGNLLGGDREYVDPRQGDFQKGGQLANTGRTFQDDTQTASGTLSRKNVPAAMQQWTGLIEEKAAKYGLPASLLAGIVEYESGGDPNAGHKTSGATGLGQVMPKGSGPWFNDRPTREQLLDPETNLEWSAKILAANYNRFGKNPQSAAAAYLGAVDKDGNPTSAADANGTTGFKYVQEVMSRAEKYESAEPQRGPTKEQLAQQQEQQMATQLSDVIDIYNKNAATIKDRIAKADTANTAAQTKLQTDTARMAELAAIPQERLKPEQEAELAALQRTIKVTQQTAKDAADSLTEARTDQEQNTAALQTAVTAASGKPLSKEEKTNLDAQSRQYDANAAKLEDELKRYKPGDPGYDEARGKADYARAQADQYKRTVDITQQRADTEQYAAETGRYNAGTGRMEAETGRYRAETERMPTQSIIQRNLMAAGLDEVSAQRIAARIDPELDDLRADTKLKGDQAAYQRAVTQRVQQLIGPEVEKEVQAGRLAKAQADKAVATLPYEIAQSEENVRATQAETGLRQGQTWAQMVQANKDQYETQLKALEAETWRNVQKVASNPNASDEDIIGAIQAGARNAQEAAQVYQTRINQYTQEEASRHNKVSEGIDIQRADEEERNNRYQNLASIQNARANMQNASTNAVGPRLGATGMANAMAGLGMVVGSEGLNRLAMQSGTGASVIDPVKAGLAPFEKDQAALRAGVRDNRLADPNAKGTAFAPPRPTAAAANIVSGGMPAFKPIDQPNVIQPTFKAPEAAPAPAPAPAMAAAPAPAPLPPPPPPAPEPPQPEEEEGGGGGPGKRLALPFKPPRAKKATAVASLKRPMVGGGGGFRVPGRRAA